MPLSYLYDVPVEGVSIKTIPLATLILGVVEIYLLCRILDWGGRIYSYFWGCQFSVRSQFTNSHSFKKSSDGKKNQEFVTSERQPTLKDKIVDGSLSKEEVEMILTRLGIFCHPEGAKLQERFDSDDVSYMLDEREPNLNEVQDAFDVFDENRDGFIDERELQRVLCALGFTEGSKMENCRRMIEAFDENGDGKIDFTEFAKMF